MKKKNINFEYISFLTDLLAQRVGYDYDLVVGVGRGGLIPATMLAYKLNKKVVNFGISTYDNMSQKLNYDIYQHIIIPDKKTRVLVVDDICDSGNTFNIIRETYKDEPNLQFTFASLFARDRVTSEVDYYGLSVSEGIWLVFPWEDAQ